MAKSEFFNGLNCSLDALDSIQCVKVYPKNNFVESFKSDYVNRYYGEYKV